MIFLFFCSLVVHVAWRELLIRADISGDLRDAARSEPEARAHHGGVGVEILARSCVHRPQTGPVPAAHPGVHLLEHHQHQVSAPPNLAAGSRSRRGGAGPTRSSDRFQGGGRGVHDQAVRRAAPEWRTFGTLLLLLLLFILLLLLLLPLLILVEEATPAVCALAAGQRAPPVCGN